VADEGRGDFGGPPRETPDADPRHVYHNVVFAIDPARQLFNGQPSTIGMWIDALGLVPGARVLHVGAGLGYYTAIMGHVVGPRGRVVAIEVDEALAFEARSNLLSLPWIDVRHGNATERFGERFDAIVINAGATHPQDAWLEALAPRGRLVVPLTLAMPPGAPLGKGFVVLLDNDRDGLEMSARVLTLVMIYSGLGIRDG
jgi:protein-L-isoaspartate(D-aspartate) O-methyltransferase